MLSAIPHTTIPGDSEADQSGNTSVVSFQYEYKVHTTHPQVRAVSSGLMR